MFYSYFVNLTTTTIHRPPLCNNYKWQRTPPRQSSENTSRSTYDDEFRWFQADAVTFMQQRTSCAFTNAITSNTPSIYRLSGQQKINLTKCSCNSTQILMTISPKLLLPTEVMAVLFSASSNLCQQDSSWTAALSLMKFCMNMYLYNL